MIRILWERWRAYRRRSYLARLKVNMRFPAIIHVRVLTGQDYEAVMTALQLTGLGDMLDTLKVTEAGGPSKNLPEAYLVVDGRRAAEGTHADMDELFKQEIATHRAPVTLLARPPGSLEYRLARQRLVASVTAS